MRCGGKGRGKRVGVGRPQDTGGKDVQASRGQYVIQPQAAKPVIDCGIQRWIAAMCRLCPQVCAAWSRV